MRLDGFIFDIDGTLVDSMGVWTEADRKFLNGRGIEYNDELSFRLRTMTFEKAAEYIMQTYTPELTAADVYNEISDIVRYKYEHEIKLMDGVRELLEELRRRHIPICAATSNTMELAVAVLESNGVSDFFDFVLTCDSVGIPKDSPEFFIGCAKRLGTDIRYTAVVEDSPHAAQTAHSLGFFTIGVSSGYFGDFELLKEYTDMRFERIRDLMGLLTGDIKEPVLA